MIHPYHEPHGRRHGEARTPGEREGLLDAIGWAAFFIWVGAAWLAGFEFGYILLGIGIVLLLMQAARRIFRLGMEGILVVIGCTFFAAGYWELWNVGIPLAPAVLIACGIALLVRQFLPREH
jgi:hypothetical protein